MATSYSRDIWSVINDAWSKLQIRPREELRDHANICGGKRITDSVYEIYRPGSGPLEMEIVFLHGLLLSNSKSAHIDTWMTDSEPPECWLATWLVERFPQARILTVSYDSSRKAQGISDLHLAAENLAYHIVALAKVGLNWGTPVMLVGHCLGGLLIKQICVYIARRECGLDKDACENFLQNLMGTFFFAMPQIGIKFKADLEHPPLLESLKLFEAGTARLNEAFEAQRSRYKWSSHGVGEAQPIRSGDYKDLIAIHDEIFVEEASSRPFMDLYVVSPKDDHFSITRPAEKTTTPFVALITFLASMLEKAKKSSLPGHQELPRELVRLESTYEEVKDRLSHSAVGVGVVGMGGIGKTTLAKQIFNELSTKFEYSCFVENVKSLPKERFSAEILAAKFMYRNGRKLHDNEITTESLRRKTFLLVLDDVDKDEQLDVWFSNFANPENEGRINIASSRLVLTSRNRRLVSRLEPDDIYEMSLLSEENSQLLLMKHAFHSKNGHRSPVLFDGDGSSTDPRQKVKEVAKKCGGLPLTLEVIGRLLRSKRSIEDWDRVLEQLDQADSSDMNDSLWNKLKVSYNDLNGMSKKLFLDAATLFNNVPLYLAHAAWNTIFPTDSKVAKGVWKELVERSLVYICREENDTGVIRLHEQLRSLGRRIADTDMVKRYWDSNKAWAMLTDDEKYKKDVEDVFGMRLHFSELSYRKRQQLKRLKPSLVLSVSSKVVVLPADIFWRMKNLRYLLLEGVDIVGTDMDMVLPKRLVMLMWSSGGKFSELPVWSNADGSRNSELTVLHLRCPNLKHLPPSFGNHDKLTILELTAARELKEIPICIGELQSLERLSISGCPDLDVLPKTLNKLAKLEHLVLRDSTKLLTIPKVRNLSKLRSLVLRNCSNLQKMPNSFESLTSLKLLDLHRCVNLEALPRSTGNLPNLQVLRLSGKFQQLPNTFGHNFPALRSLQFKYCKYLQYLPPGTFKSCKSLEKLRILYCGRLRMLSDPKDFSKLEKLDDVIIGWVDLNEQCLFKEYCFRLPAYKRKQADDRSKFIFYSRGTFTNPSRDLLSSREEHVENLVPVENQEPIRCDSLIDQELDAASNDSADDEYPEADDDQTTGLPLQKSTLGWTNLVLKGEFLNHCYLTVESCYDVGVDHINVQVHSHDQGFSSYEFAQGTENFSATSIELSVLNDKREELPSTRTQVFVNLNSIKEWQEHSSVITDRKFLDSIKPGYAVALWLRSRFPAWVIYARFASLEIFPKEEDNSSDSEDSTEEDSTDLEKYKLTETKDFILPPGEYMNQEYMRISWPGQNLEKIHVEVDAHDQGCTPEQVDEFKESFAMEKAKVERVSDTWGEVGLVDAAGLEVARRLRVYTNLYAMWGWQRHSYVVEDEAFLEAFREGCAVVLWIRSDGSNWMHYVRHGRIILIPRSNSVISRGLHIFPDASSKVETRERIQRGRSLDRMYLANQNPFLGLEKIRIVVEAHDHGIRFKDRSPDVHPSGLIKYSLDDMHPDLHSIHSTVQSVLLYPDQRNLPTWGELGILAPDGTEVGKRIKIYTNTDRHESMSWQRHSVTVENETFLSNVKLGYRVVLWLRSGPGLQSFDLSVHCARYACIELVPEISSGDQ